MISAVTVAGATDSVPVKPAAKGAAVNGSAGSSAAASPCPASRSAPARAIAGAITTSVPSGTRGARVPDPPESVGVLLGTLNVGAVGVMATPGRGALERGRLLAYPPAPAAVTHGAAADRLRPAVHAGAGDCSVRVGGEPDFDRRLAAF